MLNVYGQFGYGLILHLLYVTGGLTFSFHNIDRSLFDVATNLCGMNLEM